MVAVSNNYVSCLVMLLRACTAIIENPRKGMIGGHVATQVKHSRFSAKSIIMLCRSLNTNVKIKCMERTLSSSPESTPSLASVRMTKDYRYHMTLLHERQLQCRPVQ